MANAGAGMWEHGIAEKMECYGAPAVECGGETRMARPSRRCIHEAGAALAFQYSCGALAAAVRDDVATFHRCPRDRFLPAHALGDVCGDIQCRCRVAQLPEDRRRNRNK